MRHVFTQEERSRGYWAAIESIARRLYPLLEGRGETLARRFLFARMGGRYGK